MSGNNRKYLFVLHLLYILQMLLAFFSRNYGITYHLRIRIRNKEGINLLYKNKNGIDLLYTLTNSFHLKMFLIWNNICFIIQYQLFYFILKFFISPSHVLQYILFLTIITFDTLVYNAVIAKLAAILVINDTVPVDSLLVLCSS